MLDFFLRFYFIVVLQFVLNLFFIALCITNYKKIENLRLLLYYACFTLTQSLFGSYINIYEQTLPNRNVLANSSISILTLIEFCFFLLFILKSIKSIKFKKIVLALGLSLIFIIISYWTYSKSILESTYRFSIIESFIIIIACLYYYIEIFIIDDFDAPKNNPVFWCVTGIFLLFIILIPISLKEASMYAIDSRLTKAYTITFIGYSILFTLFIKALRCQIRI